MLILWTSPAWGRRDQLIATFVPLAGLVALFRSPVTALRAATGCPGHVARLFLGLELLGIAVAAFAIAGRTPVTQPE
jgi:hypothetical protein